MSFGTTIWNITEYVAYICIIIQTGLALMGFFGKGLEGVGSEEFLTKMIGNLGETVNRILPPTKKGSSPSSHSGKRK